MPKKKKKLKKPLHRVPGSSEFARASTASAKPKTSASLSGGSAASASGLSSPSREGGVRFESKLCLSHVENSPTLPLVAASSDLQTSSSSEIKSLHCLNPPVTAAAPSLATMGSNQNSLENKHTSDTSPTTVHLPACSEDKKSDPTDQAAPSLPRTWKSLLQDSHKLEEIGTPTEHISGVPFVLIPDESIEKAKEEFKDFIFAQFHKTPPEMGRIIGVVNALWTRNGPRIFVHKIGSGSYLLRVNNPRTRALLLSRNHWNIPGHPMFVSAWSPEFTPDTPPLTSADISVELRGVPYLLFNKESLCRIATAVGKPVALAPETEKG